MVVSHCGRTLSPAAPILVLITFCGGERAFNLFLTERFSDARSWFIRQLSRVTLWAAAPAAAVFVPAVATNPYFSREYLSCLDVPPNDVIVHRAVVSATVTIPPGYRPSRPAHCSPSPLFVCSDRSNSSTADSIFFRNSSEVSSAPRQV